MAETKEREQADVGQAAGRAAAQDEVRALRARIAALGEDGLDLIFRKARSHRAWTSRPVGDDVIRMLYETIRYSPTARNGNPARFVFVRSKEGKARLLGCVNPGNRAKVEAAPVTVIIAYDEEFWRQLDRLHPHTDNSAAFRDEPQRAQRDAFRNSTLQGAYLMIAARGLGLDVGPMSGFRHEAVDQAFFARTTLRSNFLCNLGYAEEGGLFQRLPRFDFDEACELA